MKFLAALILTALLSFIAGLYLPWWGIVIAAFVVGLLVIQKAGLSFLAGFSVFYYCGADFPFGLILKTKAYYPQG